MKLFVEPVMANPINFSIESKDKSSDCTYFAKLEVQIIGMISAYCKSVKFLTIKAILIILLVFCSSTMQNLVGQSMCAYSPVANCGFLPNGIEDSNAGLLFYKDTTLVVDTIEPIFIKIYVHAIRTDSCTGGLSADQVKNAIQILKNDFIKNGIYFIWDCEIDCLPDDDEYVNPVGDQTLSIFNHNPHEDGVDIYFYPEFSLSENRGFNTTQCILGGSAYYIAGNFHNSCDEPNFHYFETSVVSHEMGHALGLLHTHECTGSIEGNGDVCCLGCFPENVVREGPTANWRIAGDFLPTPADPNLKMGICHSDCDWHGINEDAEDSLFLPDESNIMSYTNPLCMTGFSNDQFKLMRKFLQYQDDVKLNVFNFDIDIRDIKVNTEWTTSSFPNGEATVKDKITVKSGKTLTIDEDVIVHFSPLASIVIETGGKLILNGTLTGFCGQTWKGVQVYGNSSQTQYFYSGHFYQGQIFTSSKATIENAEIGIYVSGANSHSQTGGVVVANGTLFKNNKISVLFAKYQNFYPSGGSNIPKDNISFFHECTFLNDTDYVAYKSFEEFVWLLEVDGVKFETCTFQNATTGTKNSWRDYGIGIRATDATFHVNRSCLPNDNPCDEKDQCLFEGLAYGIQNTGVMGNKPSV